MYWKWAAILMAALIVVLLLRSCNCGSGGWLGKVSMFRHPKTDGQENFVANQD